MVHASPVTVPPLSPEALIALALVIAQEPGVVTRCPCGAARFCPFTPSGTHAYEQFDELHSRCASARGA